MPKRELRPAQRRRRLMPFSGVHGTHLSIGLGVMVLVALWAGWSDVRAWMHRQGDDLAPTAVLVAALCSAAAGCVHALVVGPHWTEQPTSGLFFAATAAAQVGWGYLVVIRPRLRWLLLTGCAASRALVALWAVTRTAGLPLASVGAVQPVGPLDVTAVALELVVIVGVAQVLRSHRGGSPATTVAPPVSSQGRVVVPSARPHRSADTVFAPAARHRGRTPV